MRILLVEDDLLIGDGVNAGLIKMGFGVDWFTDGLLGRDALFRAPYDAVILDLGLPGADGMDILRYWRECAQDIPVLILTARDSIGERVSGLMTGADDYLCKPFALIEVSARLKALIRRRQGHLEPLLRHGVVEYDPAARQIKRSGKIVELSPKESALLELFLLNEKRVLSKTLIQEKLYAWDEEVSSNAIEVHIHHLRRKLGSGFIRTVHGVGYALGDME